MFTDFVIELSFSFELISESKIIQSITPNDLTDKQI